MTDLRKLLEDARSALYALGEKHYDKIAERIDAALAEPVEPVGEFSGMRITPEGTREFYGHIEPGSIPPLPGTKLYAAPADQDRVDAERYRWLLDRISGDRYPSGVARFRLPDISAHEGIFKGFVAQHFNEAIDRARSAK